MYLLHPGPCSFTETFWLSKFVRSGKRVLTNTNINSMGSNEFNAKSKIPQNMACVEHVQHGTAIKVQEGKVVTCHTEKYNL